nr:uncharacterized protein DDB_G0283697-like [Aegilops tauschii subsp. strangulata]
MASDALFTAAASDSQSEQVMELLRSILVDGEKTDLDEGHKSFVPSPAYFSAARECCTDDVENPIKIVPKGGPSTEESNKRIKSRNKSGKSKVTRRKKRKEKDSETEQDTDSDIEEEEDSKKKKLGKSNSTRRKKQKEETESDTEEETEADTEEETEADTEEEEDSGTKEEEDSDAEEAGDSDAEEEGDSDEEEEENSDAEDRGLRRARKRPLEVAEEDYAKPNKWALAQLKRKGAPNVNAGRKKKNDVTRVREENHKGGKEQAKGVMKTKRPARNVPQAERIRAVKLASVAMKRKSVKKAEVKSRQDV